MNALMILKSDHAHIRWILEENVIYPRAEKALGDNFLQALSPFMTATN